VTSKDRLLLNGQRILRVLREFSFESSGDVTINYITDNDGTEETYTMWSVRKIMDNLYGVITSYNERTVYIDGDNGDDANDGSEDNPKKTLKGVGFIKNVNYTIVVKSSFDVGGDFALNMNRVYIQRDSSVDYSVRLEARQGVDDNGKGDEIHAYMSEIMFNDIFPTFDSDADTPKSLLLSISSSSTFGVDGHETNASGGDNTLDWGDFGLVNCYIGDVNVVFREVDVQNTIINMNNGTLNLAGNSVASDNISGIIRDADSGNPININASANFSD